MGVDIVALPHITHVSCNTRRLLFLASDHLLSGGSGIGESLPYSYTLNHLFTRAPLEMKSPHQVKARRV